MAAADVDTNAPRRVPWRTIGLVVGLWIVVAVTAPALITATFSDLGTFTRVVGLTIAVVVWSWVVGRFVADTRLATVLRIVPAAAVLWFLVAPYFLQGNSIDDPSPAPESVALGTGTFQGLTGHRGAGMATIFDLGGGDLLLRLDDFDTGPGPDLDLYVVPGNDRRSRSGGVKIADLSATRGNQNHDLPDDLVLDGPITVLVWCNTFDVEVSNSTLFTD